MQELGIVPALYLDFARFCCAYCAIGLLIALPSIVGSARQASANTDVAPGYPTSFFFLSIGARVQCGTHECETLNLVAATLELAYSLLLLFGVRAFRDRVRLVAAANDANNVFTREYAVQLHGLPCVHSHGAASQPRRPFFPSHDTQRAPGPTRATRYARAPNGRACSLHRAS